MSPCDSREYPVWLTANGMSPCDIRENPVWLTANGMRCCDSRESEYVVLCSSIGRAWVMGSIPPGATHTPIHKNNECMTFSIDINIVGMDGRILF